MKVFFKKQPRALTLLCLVLYSSFSTGCHEDQKQNSLGEKEIQKTNRVYPDFVEGTMAEVTVNNLRMRSDPNRKSEVVQLLPLGTIVLLEGERSDTTEIIEIAGSASRQYWYYVSTNNKQGWIYGGGISFLEENQNPNLILPGHSIGEISKTDSEKSLIEKLGTENVVRTDFDHGMETHTLGTTIFPGTERELKLWWKENNYVNLLAAEIDHPKSPYHTSQGMRMGLGIDSVQIMNREIFSIHGFDWQYSGKLYSWEEGVLNDQLVVYFEPSDQKNYHKSLKGDQKIFSNNSRLLYCYPKIKKMRVYFNTP